MQDKTPIPAHTNERCKIMLRILRIAMAVIGAVLLGYFFVLESSLFTKKEPAEQSSEPPPPPAVVQNLPTLYYPTDVLFTTAHRDLYQDGEMTLEIPRLEYTGPVLNGVDDNALNRGVGLYDYAPLPGYAPEENIDNFNISIAGHRDLKGKEFYYIDTITDGDEIVLTYNGKRYTFTYMDTTIIEEDDWSVIKCIDAPIVTLTSCDPIGIANKRIIVRAGLSHIQDLPA